jgi:hypothetical protein
MPEKSKGPLNSESLEKVAAFMAGLDNLSNQTSVEIVGIVSITVDGVPAGSLDCGEGSETVWGHA